MHPEVVGDGQGRARGSGPPGARHLSRFSVRRAWRVRTRGDVRTVKRRKRRAPAAPAALCWKGRAPAHGAGNFANNIGMHGFHLIANESLK